MKGTKFLWMITTLVLVTVMLVACGGGDQPEVLTEEPPTETAGTATPVATPTLSASDHVDQGMAYYEQGDLDSAIAEFEKAIEIDPDYADAYRNLGTAYLEQGMWDESLAAYEQAVEANPDFGEAYGDMATAYFNLGRAEEAIAAAEKGIELAPDYAMGYNNLAAIYGAQGEVDKAMDLLQQAIELDPNLADAHYNLGLAYESTGEMDKAIAEYELAIEADPNYADAYENLGSVHARLGQLDEAIALWEETLELDPERASAYKSLGMAYAQQERTEDAIAAFETYLQLAPADAPDRAQVEGWLADLGDGPAGEATEYRSAAGGYSLPNPQGWYYEEDRAVVRFSESRTALSNAPAEAPVIMFEAVPQNEIAAKFGVPLDAGPDAYAQAAADLLNVQIGTVETGQIAGYPAALADVAGQSPSTSGALVVAIFEGRVLNGVALAPPDQWAATRPIFTTMFQGLSFFPPEYRNARGGYSLLYPPSWSHKPALSVVTLAPTRQAAESPMAEALEESPLFVFLSTPLEEGAEATDPAAIAEDMAVAFEAELGNVETGQIDGYPAAYANVSGLLEGSTPYEGGMVAIVVEERIVRGYGLAPPELWGDVRGVFSNVLDSLTFFEPTE